jgi:tetrapyrrole methylase family protein/MazG family protein
VHLNRKAKRQRPRPRVPKARHKTAKGRRKLYRIAARDRQAGEWFAKLAALQRRLYGPGGCPWDRKQTHQSLRKYLIEEAYEVLDAMDSGDPRKFCEELGDLLLQVSFHGILAEKSGKFTIPAVIENVHDKMVRRHPHVFGDVDAKTPAAVLKNWEQIKAQERAAERSITRKGRDRPIDARKPAMESILSGVPRSLPAMLEAYQLTRRASRIGFDWENLTGVLKKIDEEKRELIESIPTIPVSGKIESPSRQMEDELGDLLLSMVNLARFVGIDPEIALKKANLKFKNRFQYMEANAHREGHRLADLRRDQMEELWNESKRGRSNVPPARTSSTTSNGRSRTS